MISSGTISTFVVFLGIVCYLYGRYFPFPPPTVVGIDLGTTFSSVAVFNNGFGNVTVLKNSAGKVLVPSIVTFYKNGTINVGKYGSCREKQPYVTFYDSKRFIGRNDLIEADVSEYPFEIKIINGSAFYVLPHDFTNKKFKSNLLKPFQVSFLILEHIKGVFKETFGYYPKTAVLGVPVEFNELQRDETVKAANMAGLEVLRLVNEPTAASMACDVHNRPEVENVVVLDLGGGTFDVSVLSSLGRVLSAISIAGNDHLGGQDFTDSFAKCIVSQIDDQSFVDFEFEEFLKSVEEAKIALSSDTQTDVIFTQNKKSWNVTMTRDNFEECTHEHFLNILPPIEAALASANFTVGQIHEIVLVGGATRMPKLRKTISLYFGREPNIKVDPDTAVVIGLTNAAAIATEGWPLEKAAIDILPAKLTKIKIN